MADGADLSIDTAALDADADRLIRRYLTAGTTAVSGTTKRLERRLEAATQAAVPGRLWRAWGSSTYPRSGAAQNPVGEVYVAGGDRSRGAMTYWSMPGVNQRAGGGFLAIPLPAAGARGRDRDLTPAQWEARTGIQLRPVFRPGKVPILVADQAKLSGRGVARRNTARGIASGRGSTTVPIFELLPLQRFRNAVALAPMVATAQAELPGAFAEAAQR